MVKVYFETTKDGIHADGKYAELVAIFDSEETYYKCSEVLEEFAKESDMIVTESVEDWNTLDELTGDEE